MVGTRRCLRIFLVSLCLFGADFLTRGALTGSVAAQGLEDVDRIQGVIQGQMDAFALGDKGQAFGFAAPFLQEKFTSPDLFMEMVVQGYGVLINPHAVTFRATDFGDGRAVQVVSVLARDGQAWTAYYYMQQIADGSWRIAGVHLEKDPDGAV